MSFSQELKNSLCAIDVKNECCRRSLLYGILLFSGMDQNRIRLFTENEELVLLTAGLCYTLCGVRAECDTGYRQSENDLIPTYNATVNGSENIHKVFACFGHTSLSRLYTIQKEVFTCDHCKKAFFRGAFLAGGTVSNPENSYHLELSTPHKRLGQECNEMLESLGLSAGYTLRKNNVVLYYKSGSSISDFLDYIGSDCEPVRLFKESRRIKNSRNDANRLVNFDTANLVKAISAAQTQIDAIKKLEESGNMLRLSDELKYTAHLRLENPELSLELLADLHVPPITKSGVRHRLAKIIEESNKV